MGKHFVDAFTGIAYKIVGIDFQVLDKGAKSKIARTPLYKHYDTGLHDFPPRDEGDYEWMPCAELLRDPDTEWDAERNSYEAHSAQLSHDYLLRAMEDDRAEKLSCYSVVLKNLSAARVAVSDILPPKKFSDLATHPEGSQHLGAFMAEVESYWKNDMCLPPEIDIKDIPPDLILQLMPIWQK